MNYVVGRELQTKGLVGKKCEVEPKVEEPKLSKEPMREQERFSKSKYPRRPVPGSGGRHNLNPKKMCVKVSKELMKKYRNMCDSS